jgi:hypothetical protein
MYASFVVFSKGRWVCFSTYANSSKIGRMSNSVHLQRLFNKHKNTTYSRFMCYNSTALLN